MYAGDNSKINSIDMGNELMDSKMIFFASEYGTRAYCSHPVIQRDFLSGGGPQYNINNSFLLWWMLGGRVWICMNFSTSLASQNEFDPQ